MSRSIKNLQTDFIKYHGCGVYRIDGTNVLCTKRNPCSKPINACFWMKGNDTVHNVRTRYSELTDGVLQSIAFKNRYFKNVQKQKELQYFSSDDSELYTDSDSESVNSILNPDNKLIIDIENDVKEINKTLGPISDIVNKKLKEVNDEIKIRKQDHQNIASESPDNKNKCIPLTI